MCQGFEYTWFTQASECAGMSEDSSRIDLIMSENARMLNRSGRNLPYLKKVQKRTCIVFIKCSTTDA